MYSGRGILHYHINWLVVYTDDEIGRYYRAIITREHPSVKLNSPMHGAHITVIAGKYETPPKKDLYWGLYEGEIVDFQYSPEIHFDDGLYYWLTVECKRIEDIREELGLLPKIRFAWHLTVGNTKE